MDLLKRFAVVVSSVSILPVSILAAKHIFNDARPSAPSGTYQVVCEKNLAPQFTSGYMDSLRFEIEAKRDKEKVICIDLRPGAKVIILPKKEVESRTFRPVAEFQDGSVKKIRYEGSAP